ncbi:hypothetical protein EGW08_021435 [Elysia chlorotica]|uniref:Uncharacterized protein n=1 Tax=Elysia chlorotica TaxID=188477 RepID=A0A3S0ZB09_ELYCH|nr:hypothetical protein EGW08_021435 [Elysia chlorotica]
MLTPPQANAMTTSVSMDLENNDSDTYSDDERTSNSTITAPTSAKIIAEKENDIMGEVKAKTEESKLMGLNHDDEEDEENDDGEEELASSLLVSPDKLGPSDRDLYEKLRQQEREEREEIERELREQGQGLSLHASKPVSGLTGLGLAVGGPALPHSLALSHHAQQLRAREKEIHLAQERMLIKTERELDLSTTAVAGSIPARSSSASSSPINNSSSNCEAGRGPTPNDTTSNGSGQRNLNIGSNTKQGNNKFSINNSLSRSPSVNSLNKNSASKTPYTRGDGSTTPGSNNGDVPQHFNKHSLPPTPEEFRAHLGLTGSAAAANSFLSSFPFGHPFAAAHAHLALGGHPLLGGRDIKGMMLDGGGFGAANPLLGGAGGMPHHPSHPLVNPFHPILPNHSAFPSPPSPADRFGTPHNHPGSNSTHGGPHPGAPGSSPPSSTRSPDVEDSMQPSPAPDDDDPNGENRSHNWTFEEQFKQ